VVIEGLGVEPGGVLTAPVGMSHEPEVSAGLPGADRHPESVEDETGAHVRRQLPADHPAAEHVDYADPAVMPTRSRTSCSDGVRGAQVVGVSQVVQEGEESVGSLVAPGFGVGWIGAVDRSFLLGHVSVQIDVGRGDLLVTQPQRDDSNVVAG